MITPFNKYKRIWEKHSEEVAALLKNEFPEFVTSTSSKKRDLRDIPVFVFHEIDPNTFENQLRFLSRNNYRTLSADEFTQLNKTNKTNGNEVVLSFDDATSTFWTYAYPLLEKYGHKAIVFAIPGLTPEDETDYPNLNHYWENKYCKDNLLSRKTKQPLCTWKELEKISKSECIDVQCHSLTHSKINTSNKLIDFIHPKFDTYFYGNITIPISVHDNPNQPSRKVELASPLFQNHTRMMCKNRFYENPNLLRHMQDFVEHNGGNDFFAKKVWRKQLVNHFNKWDKNKLGNFEDNKDMLVAVTHEFRESKKILENRLNKAITHFCYPWFESSFQADQLAKQEGYDNLYYSMKLPSLEASNDKSIKRHTRLSEQYLFRLPGEGRQSFNSIWLDKVKNYFSP